MDLDIVGQITRRNGYREWSDLESSDSLPSANAFPNTSDQNTFDGKVQAIFPFTDLDGAKFLFIVANGNIYFEKIDDDSVKSWTFLNPTGIIKVNDKDNHIDVVPYLDTVFFNDYRNDILMYDTALYSLDKSSVVGASYIYFAGQNIRFRDNVDFSVDTDESILIDDTPTNIEGNAIWESLTNIGWATGPGPGPTDPADLKFGYSLSIGNTLDGFKYYTLENNLAQRGAGKMSIIRFDATLNAEAFIEFDIGVNDRVLSMAHHSGFIYLWTANGVVNKFDTDFNSAIIMSGDIASMEAPVNAAGESEFHIEANEKGVFLYSSKVPVKDDWFQPIILDNINFTDDVKTWTHYDFNTEDKTTETFQFTFAKNLIDNETLIIDREFHFYMDQDGSLNNTSYHKNSNGGKDVYIGKDRLVKDDDSAINYDLSVTITLPSVPLGAFILNPSYVNPSSYMTYVNKAGTKGITGGNGAYDDSYGTKINNIIDGKAAAIIQPTGGWNDSSIPTPPEDINARYGHEIKNNFTYTHVVSKINVFSFSDIKDNTVETYTTYTIGGEVNNLKFLAANVSPTELDQSGSGSVDGDHPAVFFSDNEFGASFQSEWDASFQDSQANQSDTPGDTIVFTSMSPDLFGDATNLSTYSFSGWFKLDSTAIVYANNSSAIVGLGTRNHVFSPVNGITLNETREGAFYNSATKLISFHENFAYDKDLAIPSDKQLWDSSLVTNNSFQYLAGSSDFDPTVFSDMTTSNYVLLQGFNYDGAYVTRTYNTLQDGENEDWRFIIPLGKISDLKTLSNISYKDNLLYFGTSMTDVSTVDNGFLMSLSLEDGVNYLNFEIRGMDYSQIRIPISGDTSQWMLVDEIINGNSAQVRIGDNWKWGTEFGDPQAKFPYSDYTDLAAYRSNLIFHVNYNPVSVINSDDDDRVRFLGTPIAPLATIDTPSNGGTGTLEDGDAFRYYKVYEFFSEEISHLSPVSSELVIPLIGAAGAQDVKLVLQSLDLLNEGGVPLYLASQVSKIRLYRAEKLSGDTVFSEALLVATLELDRTGVSEDYFYYPNPSPDTTTPFAAHTYEDQTRVLVTQPYSTGNLQTFPCEHILVHRNRLILINDKKSGNTNTVLYSEVDLAQSISRGNFRDIESGDGDALVRGLSVRDLLYLFKTGKIYAILGDVSDGQLIDISKTIGCPYKNLLAEYNNVIYFLNKDGVFAVNGREVIDIERFRLADLFDVNQEISIDFSKIDQLGFTYVDTRKEDIYFHVPIVGESALIDNVVGHGVIVIVYSVPLNALRTYHYQDDMFTQVRFNDLNGTEKVLLGDSFGKIKEGSLDNDDGGIPIVYKMKTKSFNLDNNFLRKAYNLIRVHGQYLSGSRVACNIDGREITGGSTFRQKMNGSGEIIFNIPHRGEANEIEISLEGSTIESAPAKITDILLGVTPLSGIR